ncbi:hypothetical protein HanIR_Chr07g0340431 [Helianthus annuus]|nr:hypothetical protein HanIR_Chr07g0340431 [Helianthus annuus]
MNTYIHVFIPFLPLDLDRVMDCTGSLSQEHIGLSSSTYLLVLDSLKPGL